MRLRCLVGRYAGEIQTYSSFAGLSALSTGMAERVDAPPRAAAAAIAEQPPHVETIQAVSGSVGFQGKRKSK